MRSPFSPAQLLLFLFGLGFLLALIQVGLLTITFDKLGLSQSSAFLLLFTSLFGSSINLPLFRMTTTRTAEASVPAPQRGLLRQSAQQFTGKTMVAVNVGGCLIPVTFSLYLLRNHPLSYADVSFATLLVAAVSYVAARPIPGIGIGIPVFIAPLAAAAIATLLAPELSAPLAYVGGTLGVLIGADLLRLRDIRTLGAPVASIGGAGTFDGVFLTGIVAVLLA